MRAVRLTVTAAATAAALTALTACTAKSDAEDGAAVQVTAADAECETSSKSVPAGQVTLRIENKGAKATEVEILFPDDRIVSEKENIGPGTRYTLTAEVEAGSYEIACRPGMKGHGVRQKLTVTGSGRAARRDPGLDRAVADYRRYAQDQADATVPLAGRRGYSFTDGTDGLGRLDAGLFFLAYQRDVREGFIPLQRRLAAHDALNEYIQHVGSAVFAVPPGVRDADDWWGRALLTKEA
ncbi:cupredoxin domain-containing protein [Streptomyces sp. NPDC004561]